MKKLALLVALLMMAGTAHAVSNYLEFSGSISPDWNVANNWYRLGSAGEIPVPGTTPPAANPPFTADQVLIRGGQTATVYGGYTAYMGSTSYTFNGIGSALYIDGNGESVWAAPSTVVLSDATSLLKAGTARSNGQFDIGGYYGGTMIIKGGSFNPEMYVYVGDYGNITYTAMKITDPNDPNNKIQDPAYKGITNVGLLVLDGGTITPSYTGTTTTSGTKVRMKAGYRGGEGTFLFKSGLMNWGLFGTTGQGVQWVIAEGSQASGWYPDPNYCGKTKGYMEMSGGSWNSSENLQISYRGGKGTFVQTGGTMIATNGDVSVGYIDQHDTDGWMIAANQGVGVMNLSGGSTYMQDARLMLGIGNALGTMNISDGATFQIRGVTATGNENCAGRSVVCAGGTASGNGVGVINVSSGTFQYKPNTSNTTRGTVRFGWTWDNRQLATKDPNFALTSVYSRGELHQTGGVVLYEAGGTGTSSEQVLVLGGAYATAAYPYGQPNNNSTGIIDVTGGTFKTVSTRFPVIDPESGGTIGWTTALVHLQLAGSRQCTGLMNVGRNAYVSIDGNFSMKPFGDANEPGAVARLTVDFDKTKNGCVNVNGLASLADTLVVNTTGYRPREGDKMVVVKSTDPNTVYFSGDFATISTNITLGQQGATPFFAGSISGGDYRVIFQGLTAGDANGDHSVDGGDLSLMGGNWNKSPRAWAQCDFNGDGVVDGGDLALMGGNWNYVAVDPAPEGAALPEPATLAMLGLGALAMFRRRRT